MFMTRTIVAAVLGALTVSGCAVLEPMAAKMQGATQSGMSAQQLYQAGREQQAQQRYDQAIATFVRALELDHELADAHNALGVIYSQQGLYTSAVTEFNLAIALKPGEAYLHNNLGYAWLLQHADARAADEFEIALGLDPNNERAAANLRLAQSHLPAATAQATAIVAAPAAPQPAPVAASTPAVRPDPAAAQIATVSPGVYELKLPAREAEVVPLSAPVALTDAQALDAPAPHAIKSARLEVSNGNGKRGMAGMVARVLDQHGLHATRITNNRRFDQARTEIQYRPEHRDSALALQQFIPAPMKQVSAGMDKHVEVRVLLGKDAGRLVASARHEIVSSAVDATAVRRP
jgi:Flp pilus assembly protein TadD